MQTTNKPFGFDESEVTASARLRNAHERLERLCRLLRASYASGSWDDLHGGLEAVEVFVDGHTKRLEQGTLASFRAVNPREANELIADHAILRQRLSELATKIDARCVRLADVDALVALVRAYCLRTEGLFGAWLASIESGRVDRLGEQAEERMSGPVLWRRERFERRRGPD